MPVFAVMHRNAALRAAIRRALPRRGARMVSCRTVERVYDTLEQELVEAVVVDVRAHGPDDALAIVHSYPAIPVFALSAFRPDDGQLIARCRSGGLRGLLVEGVDDGIVAEVLMSQAASRLRRAALGDAAQLLRLTEPVQLEAWNEILARVGMPTRTADVARGIGVTREHLSREFAAGGAPNLKRVIDLVRVAWAADLLRNPGYSVLTVSGILSFSSPSHLAGCARRVAGVPSGELAGLGPKGVLQRFVRGRTRSRL